MSKKNRTNIVYSTNSDYNYDTDDEELDTLDNEEQKLKVSIDRKQRKGKSVTLITGFIGTEEDLKTLGKQVKSKCGVGGSAKGNEIIIQGELKEKVFNLLVDLGFKQTKKIGG